MHPDTGATTIFIYDGYPGGAGITERGATTSERWLTATLEASGSALHARVPELRPEPKCGNGNEPLDKQGAVALLGAFLGERWG